MNEATDIGLHVIVEGNQSGVLSLKGKEVGEEINDLYNMDVSKFENGFDHDLELADYLYMVNFKGYFDRFPDKTYKQILLNYTLEMSKNKASNFKKLYLIYLSKKPTWNDTSYDYEFMTYCMYELNNGELNK